MWSSPRDRKRAEVQRRTLTPAQERRKVQREWCFNAGFDAAIRATTEPKVLRMIRFDHPQYLADRREKFEQWDLDERVRQEEPSDG